MQKMSVVFLYVCLLFAQQVSARAIRNVINGNPSNWSTVRDNHYAAGIVTPCLGHVIPFDQSRKASAIELKCTSSSDLPKSRVQEPFDLDIWLGLQLTGDYNDMHDYRSEVSNVRWDGQIAYATNVEWSWVEKLHGQNGEECDWDYKPYTCTRTVSDTTCTSDSSDYGGSSSGGGGFGSGSSGSSSGGGGSRSGGYESSSSPWGDADQEGLERAGQIAHAEDSSQGMLGVVEQLSPIRNAQAGCTTTYRTENYTCYDKIGRTCSWEVRRQGQFACQTQVATYSVQFEKPVEKWRPKGHPSCGDNCDPNYHPLIPNGYDLLPGEKEVNVVTLKGGRRLSVNLDIKNPWNKYELRTTPQVGACEMNRQHHFDIAVKTIGRIKRKSPNALILPNEQSEALKFNEHFIDGKTLKGRPYKVELVDASSEMIAAAARASRQQYNLDEVGQVEETDSEPSSELASDSARKTKNRIQAFWKDTQFRVRLIRKANKWLQRDTIWTRDLISDASFVELANSMISIPLEGGAGVDLLYHPSGTPFFLDAMLSVLRFGEVNLTPGRKYEMRISMYQRGIPFYESGCKNGQQVCEGEDVNEDVFSDELVISFISDEKIDHRGLFEKLLDFQRRRLK